MSNRRSSLIDITGQKFGRLTVLGIDEDRSQHKKYWICQCDCGNVKSVRSDSLKCGAIVSCGCKKKEQDEVNLTKHYDHLMSGTRIYETWQGMKGRCYNKHDARYNNYGGRGITVCDEWKEDFNAFYNWSLENGYSDNLTIDRINVDGNYEPDNCRWTDLKTQCNNRTTNINITIGNSTKTLTEWCEIFKVDYKKTYARYKRNEFISIDKLFNS